MKAFASLFLLSLISAGLIPSHSRSSTNLLARDTESDYGKQEPNGQGKRNGETSSSDYTRRSEEADYGDYNKRDGETDYSDYTKRSEEADYGDYNKRDGETSDGDYTKRSEETDYSDYTTAESEKRAEESPEYK